MKSKSTSKSLISELLSFQIDKTEKAIETKLESLIKNKTFLNGVSKSINYLSMTNGFKRKSMERFLNYFELPVKKKQDRILFEIQELRMQLSLLQSQVNNDKQKNIINKIDFIENQILETPKVNKLNKEVNSSLQGN